MLLFSHTTKGIKGILGRVLNERRIKCSHSPQERIWIRPIYKILCDKTTLLIRPGSKEKKKKEIKCVSKLSSFCQGWKKVLHGPRSLKLCNCQAIVRQYLLWHRHTEEHESREQTLMINEVLTQFHPRWTMKSQLLLMLKEIFHTQPSLLCSPQLYISKIFYSTTPSDFQILNLE